MRLLCEVGFKLGAQKTTASTNDTYNLAQKDSLVNYQIVRVGAGDVSFTDDNFGVVPEPFALALLGMGALLTLRRRHIA